MSPASSAWAAAWPRTSPAPSSGGWLPEGRARGAERSWHGHGRDSSAVHLAKDAQRRATQRACEGRLGVGLAWASSVSKASRGSLSLHRKYGFATTSRNSVPWREWLMGVREWGRADELAIWIAET